MHSCALGGLKTAQIHEQHFSMGRKATVVESVLFGTVISISARENRTPHVVTALGCLSLVSGMVMVLVEGPNSVFGDEGFFLLPLRSCPVPCLTLL